VDILLLVYCHVLLQILTYPPTCEHYPEVEVVVVEVVLVLVLVLVLVHNRDIMMVHPQTGCNMVSGVVWVGVWEYQ
jgi:hypothetical protein